MCVREWDREECYTGWEKEIDREKERCASGKTKILLKIRERKGRKKERKTKLPNTNIGREIETDLHGNEKKSDRDIDRYIEFLNTNGKSVARENKKRERGATKEGQRHRDREGEREKV